MTNNHGPFRVDHVGSFLRPKELVEAREAFAVNCSGRPSYSSFSF